MPRSFVGVDIGSTAVRGVQAKVSRKGTVVISHAAEIALPDETIIAGELREPTILTNALKLLWKTGRFSSRNVAMGIASQQTMVRQVDLPYDFGEDFKDTLPYKVQQDLPVDASELSLDYYPLGDYLDAKDNNRRKALLVGAMNNTIENYMDALVQAKLKPYTVDFSGFSLIRAAVFTAGDPKTVPGPPEPDDEYPCEVLVHMGANLTIISIHYNGRPLFIRLLTGGGASVTRAISDHMSIRWEVAEALKKTSGRDLKQFDKETRQFAEEVPPEYYAVAAQIVNVMSSSLVQSVRESVEYFLAASPQVSGVSRVLLSGGGVMLPGYGERLAAELRTNVALLAPVTKYGKKKAYAGYDPRFGLAFGLAMRAG